LRFLLRSLVIGTGPSAVHPAHVIHQFGVQKILRACSQVAYHEMQSSCMCLFAGVVHVACGNEPVLRSTPGTTYAWPFRRARFRIRRASVGR
jgi:hypothetical protein